MPGLPRQSENSSASHLNGEVLETPLFDTPDARDQPITPRTANGLKPGTIPLSTSLFSTGI